MTDDAYLKEVQRKLTPEVIRANLVRAGLFLAGWELLKSNIVKKVREFYFLGFPESPLEAQRYAETVLALDKGKEKGKVFRASLLWLVESGAFTPAQAERVRELNALRNDIAHELPKRLIEPEHPELEVAVLHELKDLISVLGVYWGRIEIETNEDFVGKEIADADIVSGHSLLMDHLVEAAEVVEEKRSP